MTLAEFIFFGFRHGNYHSIGKLSKAINAKQKQIATLSKNVKNSVEVVGNKATNHGRYFIK